MATPTVKLVEIGDLTFKVTLMVTPGFPGVYGGPPDAWEPPEGPEVESEEVELVREDLSLEPFSMDSFVEKFGGDEAYEGLVNKMLEDMDFSEDEEEER